MPRRAGPGRPKGSANKITSAAREAFLLTFENLAPDIEGWIREVGDGYDAIHFLSDGTRCKYKERDPGRAAELMIRMAEYHFPKLARTEFGNAEQKPFVIEKVTHVVTDGEGNPDDG